MKVGRKAGCACASHDSSACRVGVSMVQKVAEASLAPCRMVGGVGRLAADWIWEGVESGPERWTRNVGSASGAEGGGAGGWEGFGGAVELSASSCSYARWS